MPPHNPDQSTWQSFSQEQANSSSEFGLGATWNFAPPASALNEEESECKLHLDAPGGSPTEYQPQHLVGEALSSLLDE